MFAGHQRVWDRPGMPKKRIDRSEVISTAAAVADADGLDGVGLARVADDLGVKSSALYNHVNGVDGLLEGMAGHAARNLAEALLHAAVARSGEDALREVARAYRGFARDYPGQYASLLLPVGRDLEAAKPPQRTAVEVFVRVLESIGVAPGDAVHAAGVVRSAVHGFVALEAADAFVLDEDLDTSFDYLCDFLVAGLHADLD